MHNIANFTKLSKPLSSKLINGIAAGLVLSFTTTGHASAQVTTPADFFFTPPGAQVDSDPILDIIIGPGAPITFSPGLIDNFIRPAIYESYTVEYRVSWDTTELSYNANPAISGLALTSDFSLAETCLTNCSLAFTTVSPVNDGLSDFSYILDNVFINQIGLATNGPAPRDNITASFAPTNDFSNRGVPVTPGTGFQQVVEVQTDIPPVPGPLPLLGIGAAYGVSRKLRLRIKSGKVPLLSTIN